jgi:hypothetical protein
MSDVVRSNRWDDGDDSCKRERHNPSASEKEMSALSPIADEFLRVLLAHEDGITDDVLRGQYGVRYEALPAAINELLGINRIQLFTQGNSLLYKAIKEETAQKFEGLGPEQVLVYQAIERSGNK